MWASTPTQRVASLFVGADALIRPTAFGHAAAMKKDHTEVILCGRSKRNRAAVFTFSHHKSLLLPSTKVKVKGYKKGMTAHGDNLLILNLSIRYHFPPGMSTDGAEKGGKN